jgi:hypothetical protein
MHESITSKRVIEAAEESMFGMGTTGFCLACGDDQDGCEPDMEGGLCESCGEHKVMGATGLLMHCTSII